MAEKPLKGPPAFYLDFLLFPLVAAATIPFVTNFWLIPAGVLLFSFMEYWIHRVPLHSFYYHGVHEHHHKHPDDYSVFPWYFTPTVFLTFFAVFPVSIFLGLVLGYLWFLTWHHILHHFDLNKFPRWVRKYALWHLKHHHDDDCNFGIILPIWDHVFRTYK